jgi:hypothetical protein
LDATVPGAVFFDLAPEGTRRTQFSRKTFDPTVPAAVIFRFGAGRNRYAESRCSRRFSIRSISCHAICSARSWLTSPSTMQIATRSFHNSIKEADSDSGLRCIFADFLNSYISFDPPYSVTVQRDYLLCDIIVHICFIFSFAFYSSVLKINYFFDLLARAIKVLRDCDGLSPAIKADIACMSMKEQVAKGTKGFSVQSFYEANKYQTRVGL